MSEINEARERLRNLIGDEPALPPVIPSLSNLDAAVLPPMPPIVQRLEERVVREGKLDSSGRLDELTDKAFDKLEEILDMDPEDGKMLTTQLSACQTIVNLQAKVDDTRLRKRQTDLLPKLLEIMKREEKKLPRVIDHVACLSTPKRFVLNR